MRAGERAPNASISNEGADGARRLSRRALLGTTGLVAGALGPAFLGRALAQATSSGTTGSRPSPVQQQALRVLGRQSLRAPDSVPYPKLAPGTDTMPGIAHVVVLVMENHSFDNLLGTLGRGDGFRLGADGRPTATNPYSDGRTQHAFRMPTTCQLSAAPSQTWKASHESYDGGRMDGFVRASGGVAMGYWTKRDLPFTHSLASAFPVADRWFCSVLGQTDPNRRYLIAATSGGFTDDISATPAIGTAAQDALLAQRGNGTIFERLTSYGIGWINYTASYPLGATPELFPAVDTSLESLAHRRPFDQFFADAATGSLPAFSFLDEDYDTQSQENPQNIVVGEAMLARVVHTLGNGPAWRQSLLVLTYDEHGGYFDHVPPPVALAPDALPPVVAPGESTYDGFERYGIRVPGLIVSPYARRNHVSHLVFDHTSVLALVERKWNLPAMTYRDANANDLTDLLDLGALAQRRPVFPVLPDLSSPGDTEDALACSSSGPGTVPVPGSISPAA